MHKNHTIFSRIIKILPRDQFDRIVERYKGNKNTRELKCWTHFMALLFGQLTGRKSLRDIVSNFNSHVGRLYHLGCKTIARSSLADANNNRESGIYVEVFNKVLSATSMKSKDSKEIIEVLDSTEVIVSKKFGWAYGHNGKNGVKVHTVFDLNESRPTYFTISCVRKNDISEAKELRIVKGSTYIFDRGYYDFGWWKKIDSIGARFITRLKKSSPTHLVKERKAKGNEEFDVISDITARLNTRMAKSRKNPYDKAIRVIKVKLRGYASKDAITIISNDLKSSAIKLCQLYKKRWQIELFFKWVKQNLKIKSFLGTSENAVKIQVAIAMIAYLLSQYLLKVSRVGISLLRFSQLLQTNLMECKLLQNLLLSSNPPNPHIIPHQLRFAI